MWTIVSEYCLTLPQIYCPKNALLFFSVPTKNRKKTSHLAIDRVTILNGTHTFREFYQHGGERMKKVLCLLYSARKQFYILK